MRARAPGKLVISGAYAVLEGAPAITTAVDRYATADTERRAPFRTPEVDAALQGEPAPWFDASELRDRGEKLGLGSSAAILCASLGAVLGEAIGNEEELRRKVLPRALAAHRKAQGGGSGIDVVTSVYGRTLEIRVEAHAGQPRQLALPSDLHLSVWASDAPASTRDMLRAVADLRETNPRLYASLLSRLESGAQAAVDAADRGIAGDFMAAVSHQTGALRDLGSAAAIPVVLDELWALRTQLETKGFICHPAGAGGGDISLVLGTSPPDPEVTEALEQAGQRRIALATDAPGLHLAL